jgi:N-carbamoyl-L-amino-acid hydrolase
MNAQDLRVDAERLRADLASLGDIGRQPCGGINRTAFSAADAESRQWYADRAAAAGLEVTIDGLGTMVAQAPHENPELGAVWSGSHIDAVPLGGAFDGALGTVAALECVRRIAESGIELRRPAASVIFSDEEGNYSHLLGSFGLSNGYGTEELEAMTGRDGDRLVDALAAFEWTRGLATETKLAPAKVASFVELHIEQGPHLEAAGLQIGVVTSIVGLGGATVRFDGQPDHAGTTPMSMRKDALLAAAAFVTGLPDIAAGVSEHAVVTCGILRLEPGGANVVPGVATVTLDFRDPVRERLDELERAIEQAAHDAAERHGLTVTWKADPSIDPVPLDESLRGAIRRQTERLGLSHTDIPSGAGHDSQNMAHIAPTAMIFVPSKAGRSHSAAEFTEFDDVVNGANVLLATMIELASR